MATFTGNANLSNTGGPVGPVTTPLTWSNDASVVSIQEIVLASGFNAITPPATATLCAIIPPTNNTQTLTYKGVTGDTGVAMSKTQPWVCALAQGATFGITAGGNTSAITYFVFYGV